MSFKCGDVEVRALPVLVFLGLPWTAGKFKKQGGTVKMSISNVEFSMNSSPPLEFPILQRNSEKQRAIADKAIESIPGSTEDNSTKSNGIYKAVSDIERVSQAFNKKLQFVVDHTSNEVIVKVIDRATDKVIKVLPPEELQRLHRKLRETISFLFNEKV